ncbi:MAG: hypothetical protein RL536_345 [Candidatus Parcubacteria bacterium]
MSIIVKTYGGLGNQLFQYAFARSVSARLKTDFLLDIDVSPIYKDLRVHKFSLEYFHTIVRPAKANDLSGFVWLKRHKKIFNFLYKYIRLKSKLMPFYYPEKTFGYDPDVFFKGKNTYFDGFWQTEKYFKNIESEIRKEVTVINPLSDYSQGISDRIQKSNAVSLHVRRTDYVTHAASNAFHGVCSPEFYREAIDYIAERVSSPHFFIFSDDYDWVVENFKFLKYPYLCIKNGADKNYEDLALMSHCKHHIIANSSFSWWGAWLNPRKDKIVIAPKRWFANSPKQSTVDLLPESWIQL